MRPTDMEKLFREMHTPAPGRLDERVYRTIDQAAGSVPAWRRIMRHPITKLAVAAVLTIGLFCLARQMIGKEGASTQPPVESARDRPDEIPERRVIVDEVDSTELDEAKGLFEQGEVGGLLTLLEDGSDEVKPAVARYLEEIGSAEAISVLQKLADAWQGPEGSNPFQKAIDAIQKRMDAVQTDDVQAINGQPETRDGNDPGRALSGLLRESQRANYEGIIIDESGKALPGVRIWGQSIGYDLTCVVLAEQAHTNGKGRFSISVNNAAYPNELYRMLYFDHPEYALSGFKVKQTLIRADVLLPILRPPVFGPSGQRVHAVESDSELVLYRPTAVKGTVVDTEGRVLEGVRVEAQWKIDPDNRIKDALNLWSLHNMAARTDNQGRFVFNRIPERARLHIRAIGPGYGIYSTWTDQPGGSSARFYPVEAGCDDWKIALAPGTPIRGRILNEQGGAYEKPAWIVVHNNRMNEIISNTDSKGEFVTTGLGPGRYPVYAVTHDGALLCAPRDIQISASQGSVHVEFKAARRSPVVVRVIDEKSKRPIEGNWVYAKYPGRTDSVSAGQAMTDAQGECVLELPIGKFTLKTSGWNNGAGQTHQQEIVVANGQSTPRVLFAVSSRPTIRAQLIDLQGHPLQGTIEIRGQTYEVRDANGWCTFPEPPPTTSVCVAFDRMHRMGRLFRWDSEMKDDPLVLVLEDLVSITGRVVDKEGEPILGASVWLGLVNPQGRRTLNAFSCKDL